jgi:hypothetical protein
MDVHPELERLNLNSGHMEFSGVIFSSAAFQGKQCAAAVLTVMMTFAPIYF